MVRGRFLSLREEDFVMAAELVGCSKSRIIFRHMVPSFLSHIIAATTLAIPAMIISETSLSFLGLGLRPPAISWGVLLQDAQNVQALAIAPWLLVPAVPVVVAVLAFNFLGDGLRDAADPYGCSAATHEPRRRTLLLSVRNLRTYFFQDEGTAKAVDGASLRRARGQDARHRRRERLRQERHRAVDPAHRRARRAGSSSGEILLTRPDGGVTRPRAGRRPTAGRCARSAAARSP